MTPTTARARFADHALAAYLGPLVEGRRVAVVGPTSGDVARRVRALGAQTVVCFGGQGEDLAVRALIPGAIAGFHGKLDLVLVPSAGAVPSLVAVLDESRRALGSEGIVVVVSEPEDGPIALEDGAKRSSSYHDLRDLCAARFARVHMLGRGPFVGYTVASLEVPAGAVALETRLMEGDPPRPEAFVAVASDSLVALDAMAVVQIPGEVVHEVREGASRALKEELTTQGQKLKEVEAASAERWVKIQRYEHHLKELEEESRKTRDKAVRLSKDLEDERKLRQRIELDAQMSRRAPELPRGTDDELKRAREALTALELELKSVTEKLGVAQRERTEAKGAFEASRVRINDLERELDETQAVESDIRAQLDEALEKEQGPTAQELAKREKTIHDLRAALETERRRPAKVIKELDAGELARQRAQWEKAHAESAQQAEREHARLENELRARGIELVKLSSERERMVQAVRELTFTVEQLSQRDLAVEAAALRSTMGEMRSVSGALADRAEELVRENDLLRERLGRSEASALNDADAVVREVVREVTEVGAPSGVGRAALEALEAERDALTRRLEATEAAHEGAIAGARLRARELEAEANDLRRALIEEHGSRELHARTADEARNDVSRLYAINAGLEARLTHAQNELDGARAGYNLRLAEQAREAQGLSAQLSGMTFRAVECERALGELSVQVESANKARDELVGITRAEATGREFRLREAEQALVEIRVHPGAVAARSEEPSVTSKALADLDLDLDGGHGSSPAGMDQVLADLSATAERLAQTEEMLAEVRSEGASRDGDLRLLVEKLDARDIELRDTQAKLSQELAVMQQSLVAEGRSNASMREVVEAVRGGISAILIDGRGAVVAHDLVLLLRRLEEV